jgi:hypothetical protein
MGAKGPETSGKQGMGQNAEEGPGSLGEARLEHEQEHETDVLIVGGGVCGTALLFELARYTDLARLTLVERYERLAQVNSRATNNR